MFLQLLLPRLRLHEFLHFLLLLLLREKLASPFRQGTENSPPSLSLSFEQYFDRLEPPLLDQRSTNHQYRFVLLSIISVCLASLFDEEDGSLFPPRFDVVFDARSRSSIVLRDVHRAAGSPCAVFSMKFSRHKRRGGAQLLKTAWVGWYFEILVWKGSGEWKKEAWTEGQSGGWLGVSWVSSGASVLFLKDFYFWTADAVVLPRYRKHVAA